MHWPSQVVHRLEVILGGGHDDTTFGPGLMKALQRFKPEVGVELDGLARRG